MKSNKEANHYTRQTLQEEQTRLKRVIKMQETELRQRVQKVPGELFYAGIDAVIPGALTGRISNMILNAGRNFINKSVVKKDAGNTARLVAVAKHAGLFTLLKFVYNSFIRKK